MFFQIRIVFEGSYVLALHVLLGVRGHGLGGAIIAAWVSTCILQVICTTAIVFVDGGDDCLRRL